MNAKIHKSIEQMAVPISSLGWLINNPRIGDIEALKASLEEFGQVKPIVVHQDSEGTNIIIAGNHTAKAALALGWTHIAAAIDTEMTDEQAIAFALIDNRTSELGHFDPELLASEIVSVYDYYPAVFEAAGWDDFEVAALESGFEEVSGDLPSGQAGGYTPPVLISNEPTVKPVVVEDEEDGPRLVAPVGTDAASTVVSGVGGATSQSPQPKKAAVQYTIAFDDQDQMSTWWEFVRFLRSSSVYEGETIAERLIQFIEAHADFE